MPMIIKTYLIQKPIKGTCLMAGEDIKKGQVVYKDDRSFDRVFNTAQFNNLPTLLQEFVNIYSSYNKQADEYYLCCDNARFFNHSKNTNTFYNKETTEVIALTDIKKGEELTSNYAEFCDNFAESPDFEIVEN